MADWPATNCDGETVLCIRRSLTVTWWLVSSNTERAGAAGHRAGVGAGDVGVVHLRRGAADLAGGGAGVVVQVGGLTERGRGRAAGAEQHVLPQRDAGRVGDRHGLAGGQRAEVPHHLGVDAGRVADRAVRRWIADRVHRRRGEAVGADGRRGGQRRCAGVLDAGAVVEEPAAEELLVRGQVVGHRDRVGGGPAGVGDGEGVDGRMVVHAAQQLRLGARLGLGDLQRGDGGGGLAAVGRLHVRVGDRQRRWRRRPARCAARCWRSRWRCCAPRCRPAASWCSPPR